MRTSPAGGAGWQSMPAREQLGDERVVRGARGSTAIGGEAGRRRRRGRCSRPCRRPGRSPTATPLHGAALQRRRPGRRCGRCWGWAVRVTIMRPRTSTPARSMGAAVGRRRSPSSVTRMSMSASSANRIGALDADLAGVGEHDDPAGARDDRPLGGGLVAVGGGQAVLDGEAVGADEGDVGAELGPAPRRSRGRRPHGWWRGPGPAAGAARSCGEPASRAAIGTAWVTTVSRRSRGSRPASRAVVLPASRMTVEPARGQQVERGGGDPRPSARCCDGRGPGGRPRSP